MAKLKSDPIPTQIRITDRPTIEKIVAEQRREGDKKPTRTACKMIDRYCAARQLQPS